MRRRWIFASWLAVCGFAVFLFVRDRSSTDVVERSGESATAVDADGANLVALERENEHPSSRSSVEPTTGPDEVTSIITPDDPHAPLLRIHVSDEETGNDVVEICHAILTPESAIRGWVGRDGSVDELARESVHAIGINGWAACAVQANVALRVRIVGDHDASSVTELRVAPLVADETRILRLELAPQRDRTFCGRVVSAEDGTPIADAEISLPPRLDGNVIRERGAPREVVAARTSADGRFRVRAASASEPELHIVAAGFVRTNVACDEGHEAVERELSIALRRSARLIVHPKGGSADSRRLTYLNLVESGRGLSNGFYRFKAPPGSERMGGMTAINDRQSMESEDLPSQVDLELRLEDARQDGPQRRILSFRLEPGETREVDVELEAAEENGTPIQIDGVEDFIH